MIPQDRARYQWVNDSGYCGSSSVQIIGLGFGFWMSQNQGRKLAGGEVLLGTNMNKLLNDLNLKFSNFNAGQSEGKIRRMNFLQWIRDAMKNDYPVIIAVKTHASWGGDAEYDHIFPIYSVVGHSTGYHGDDIMWYADGFDVSGWYRTFDAWRDGWQDKSQSYYLPENRQYGVKITGALGEDETVPITLTVDANKEPNITLGEDPIALDARVHMQNLFPGNTYTLLRWDTDHEKINTVPTSNFLTSAANQNIETTFVASKPVKVHTTTFQSDGITIFKLVKGAVEKSDE